MRIIALLDVLLKIHLMRSMTIPAINIKRAKMIAGPWYLLALMILSISFSVAASSSVKRTSSAFVESSSLLQMQHQPTFFVKRAISIRGGDENNQSESVIGGVLTGLLVGLGKATLATVSAVQRAISAAFESDEMEELEESSAVTKILRTLGRMWNAAVDFPPGNDGEEEGAFNTNSKESISPGSTKAYSEPITEFGGFLSKSYGVDREEGASTVLGGTVGDALRDARSKARLLLVFIPAERPSSKRKKTSDQLAIQSLLSQGVTQASNKPSRKKATTGSFLLWGAKASSPEAMTAMKRLKVKQPKGGNRPTLVVVYPAQVLDSSGQPKLVPRLLAQHHCSPPPTPESMAAWLNALRKRHAKQFASMQHELKEVQLYKERQHGYRSSVQNDLKRQEQEQRAEEERLAKEATEQARQERLSQRRVELLASLPPEPPKEFSFTIALRFANGNSGQRRFAPDTLLTVVFSWVDAMYDMERELVVLTTMNGQKSFAWDDLGTLTLEKAGLGRMTGLRVSQKTDVDDKLEDEPV